MHFPLPSSFLRRHTPPCQASFSMYSPPAALLLRHAHSNSMRVDTAPDSEVVVELTQHVCRHANGHVYRHVYGHVYRHVYGHVYRHVYGHVHGHVCGHVHKHAYRHAHRIAKSLLDYHGDGFVYDLGTHFEEARTHEHTLARAHTHTCARHSS